MDVIERIGRDARPDRHQVMDAAEFAWRAYARAAQEQKPTLPAAEADLGPGLADAKARPRVYRSSAYAEFVVNEETGEVVVKIIDAETGRIVRSLPPDELANFLRSGEDWTRQWQVYI